MFVTFTDSVETYSKRTTTTTKTIMRITGHHWKDVFAHSYPPTDIEEKVLRNKSP